LTRPLLLVGLGLFSFDWEFNPFGTRNRPLADEQDRMYEKVVMRKDLTWSDSKPVPHDVVFSFKTIMTSAVPVTAAPARTRSSGSKPMTITRSCSSRRSLCDEWWNLNFP
jgi:peptide/nickel transport system substrate-binding protein